MATEVSLPTKTGHARPEGTWVRARLVDGSRVLGTFNPRSFASSDASLRDIYLEELWEADEDVWFTHPLPTTKGIWISGDQIGAIEFFSLSPFD